MRPFDRRRWLWRLRLTARELTHARGGGQPSHDFYIDNDPRLFHRMPSIIVPRGATNWVDRGDPDLPQLVTVLRHFLGADRVIGDERLEGAARDIQGLVWGDATEQHVSGYLRRLGEELGIDENE